MGPIRRGVRLYPRGGQGGYLMRDAVLGWRVHAEQLYDPRASAHIYPKQFPTRASAIRFGAR